MLCLLLLGWITGSKSDINEPILASMTWTEDNGFKLVPNVLANTVDTVAWANFTNAINQTGWSYLEIRTEGKFPDKIQVKSSIL